MSAPLDSPRRQTVMQYSLRGMMIATFAVAVACMILIPLLKWLALDAWSMQKIFGCAFLGATATVIFRCVLRYRIERRCGPLLLVLDAASSTKTRRWLIGNSLVCGTMWIVFDLQAASRNPQMYVLPMNSFMGGCFVAGAFLAIWWKGVTHSCELCENGVLHFGWRFYEWSKFRGYRRAVDQTLQLLMKHDFITLRVPAELDARVLDILETHLPNRPHADTNAAKLHFP